MTPDPFPSATFLMADLEMKKIYYCWNYICNNEKKKILISTDKWQKILLDSEHPGS